jgi:Flp pilus assembly protein TadG
MIPKLRRGRNRPAGARGQSVVEFALVFPVFVLVLAGIIDFGLGLFSYMSMINGAREGARLGVVVSDKTNLPSTVQSRVTGMAAGLDPGELTVTTTCVRVSVACTEPQWQPGDAVRVVVDYTYHMVWPLTFGTQIPMRASVEMRIE